jgi:hypothetical protein
LGEELVSVTDTGSSPKNVRDRHRLLPQKLVLLLYIDATIVSGLHPNKLTAGGDKHEIDNGLTKHSYRQK